MMSYIAHRGSTVKQNSGVIYRIIRQVRSVRFVFALEGDLTMTYSPHVKDEGLFSRIPDSAVSLKAFVEAYHRLGGDLEILRTGFYLEPWQLHAAMTYYCANKAVFDAENTRILEERQKNLAEFFEKHPSTGAWAEFKGALRGDETDEEVDAALEELS